MKDNINPYVKHKELSKEAIGLLKRILNPTIKDDNSEETKWVTIKGTPVKIDPDKPAKNGENILNKKLKEKIKKTSKGKNILSVTQEDIKNGKIPNYVKEGWKNKTLERIPPSAKNVRIFKNMAGTYWCKFQDSKGRTQSKRTPDAIKKADEKKWGTVRYLKSNATKLDKELKNILKTDKEAGLVLLLMRTTGIRVGSNKDTKAKVQAYGATTLKGEHIKVNGNEVRLQFVGKHGKNQDLIVKNPILKRELIARKKNDKIFNTTETKLNSIMKNIGKTIGWKGDRVHNHNLRHLLASEIADKEIDKFIKENGNIRTTKQEKLCKKIVLEKVSHQLGNTPQMAEKSYVLPEILRRIKKEDIQ